MALVTLQEVRDEGFSSALYSDTRVNDAIEWVTDYIEELTGNFFEPRALVLALDGDRTSTLLLPYPIIEITKVSEGGDDYDLDDLVIYNRHLSGGKVLWDDRKNPKIMFGVDYDTNYSSSPFSSGRFPYGKKNITVEGTFAYRDYDSGDVTGKVPSLLKRALYLLLPRFLEKAGTKAGRSAWSTSVSKRVKTRQQECEFGGAVVMGNVMGSLTGTWEIDQILSKFTRPTSGMIV